MSNEAPLPAPRTAAAPPDAGKNPAAPVAGDLPFDLLAEPLRGQIEWIQRRHGLTPAAASIAVLATVLCVCGPSHRIYNPISGRSMPPALSVALHGGPAAYLQAAVELSLDPVRQWIVRRIGPPDKSQLRRTRLRLGELHQERIAKEFQLHSTDAGALASGGEFGSTVKGSTLEEHQKPLKEQHAKILREINDVTFLLRPHLLVDDTALSRLLDPGLLSTDGAVLHTSLDGHAVLAWTGASNAIKLEFARLLHLAWHGLPDAGDEDCHTRPLLSNVLVVNQAAAKLLSSDRGLATAGVTKQLLFLNAASEYAKLDLSVHYPDETSNLWTSTLQALLGTRLAGRLVDHRLDNAAAAVFDTFGRELLTEARSLAPESASRLEQTPVLALKLALLVHVISPGPEDHAIGEKTMDFACALASAVSLENLRFMNPAKPGATAPGDDAMTALVAKLRLRGPLRWRELLRSQRVHKAEPLEKLLGQAIAAGAIRKEGDLYHAVRPGTAP